MKKISAIVLVFLHTALFAQTDSAFTETRVTVHTSVGELFGTLTVPKNKNKMSVALIIAGSGPTDRNGNNATMNNRSLMQLAHRMANEGIASLRYDKRGVGESKNATGKLEETVFEDFVNDAKLWLALLNDDKRFSSVGIIGHSEGSLIGMLASNNRTDFFISIAGPGRKLETVLREQLSAQPAMVKDLALPILDSLAAGKRVENVNPILNSLFRPSVQPFILSLFKYDPAVIISKLKTPAMIIQGTNDLQVTQADADALSAAQPKAKKILIENMNHVLKEIAGNRIENLMSYNNPALPVSKQLTDAVIGFIKDVKK